MLDAKDAVSAALDWLREYTRDENGDGFGDGSRWPSVSTGSSAWNSAGGGIPAGSTIAGWLDEYNNGGTVLGTQIALDRDAIA